MGFSRSLLPAFPNLKPVLCDSITVPPCLMTNQCHDKTQDFERNCLKKPLKPLKSCFKLGEKSRLGQFKE